MEKANKKQRPHIEMGKAEDKEEEEEDNRTPSAPDSEEFQVEKLIMDLEIGKAEDK